MDVPCDILKCVFNLNCQHRCMKIGECSETERREIAECYKGKDSGGEGEGSPVNETTGVECDDSKAPDRTE